MVTSGAIAAAAALTSSAEAEPARGVGHGGLPPGKDVRVINKTSEAVPVSIQGAAQIDTSSPIPVRDVDHRAQQPVQFTLARGLGGRQSYTVPDGKRLVIEHLSGKAVKDDGDLLWLIVTTAAGSGREHYLPVDRVFQPGSAKVYAFSIAAKLYGDPGSAVTLDFEVRGGSLDLDVIVTGSGYLMDVP